MVCLEKMLNFDDFTSLNFSYILGTGIRLLLVRSFQFVHLSNFFETLKRLTNIFHSHG